MSVTGIFSTISHHQVGSSLAPSRLTTNEFQQLGQDLASGNLSAAESDMAILQQPLASPATATSSSSSSTSSVAQAFQQLTADIKSGNLTAAQKDYANIQQDLQNAFRAPHHHHVPRTSSGQDPLTQSLNHQNSSTASPGSMLLAQKMYASQQSAIGDITQSTDPGFVSLQA
jgi:hypothetical protein